MLVCKDYLTIDETKEILEEKYPRQGEKIAIHSMLNGSWTDGKIAVVCSNNIAGTFSIVKDKENV